MAPKIRLKLSKPRPEATLNGGGSDASPPPSTTLPSKRPATGLPSPAPAEKRTRLSAPSPAYGGSVSPAYTGAAGSVSPSYFKAGMSPHPAHRSRPKSATLGGVLTVSVMQLLKEISAGGFVNKTIVVATKATTLGGLADKLAQHKVLAMPVVDDDGRYIDMLDMMDILHYLVSTFTPDEIEATKTPPKTVSSAQWHEMIVKGERLMRDTTVEDLLSRRRATQGDVKVERHVDAHATVKELFDVFLRSRTGDGRPVHRVVLLTEEGNIRAMVSQTDMLRYFIARGDTVEANALHAAASLKELSLNKRRVVVAGHTSSVLYGFYKMHRYNTHSIAVIDEKQSLVRHFSASDLRGLTSEDFPKLLQSLESYGAPRAPVTVSRSAGLWDTVQLFVSKRLHRACIVDNQNRPYSLVSITNLLTMLSKTPEED